MGSPDAPVFYRHCPLQVSSRSANGACQCPGPKVPVLCRSRRWSPSIDSTHPILHYQLARSQYKYMKLAASAVALLIPFVCPFGPLSVDAPATARPFLFSHAPFVLVLIPFFLLSVARQLFSLIQTRRARIQLRLFPAKKNDRCICDLRPRPPEDLGNSSRLTSIHIRCRQSKVISRLALSEPAKRRRKTQIAEKRLPPPHLPRFFFWSASL